MLEPPDEPEPLDELPDDELPPDGRSSELLSDELADEEETTLTLPAETPLTALRDTVDTLPTDEPCAALTRAPASEMRRLDACPCSETCTGALTLSRETRDCSPKEICACFGSCAVRMSELIRPDTARVVWDSREKRRVWPGASTTCTAIPPIWLRVRRISLFASATSRTATPPRRNSSFPSITWMLYGACAVCELAGAAAAARPT